MVLASFIPVRRPARAPRVGILVPPQRNPSRGVARYSRLVIQQLRRSAALKPVVITYRLPGSGLLEPGQVTGAERQYLGQTVYAPRLMHQLEAIVPTRYFAEGQRLLFEQVGSRLAAWRLGVDLLYSPYHALPLVPLCPSVVTIHDLIPLSEPGYAGSLHVRALFALACAAARQATAVITVSEYAKREIVRHLGIPESCIYVSPNGVEPIFTATCDQMALARARSRLSLPDRYLLYVGGSDLRKNIGVLLRAVVLLRDQGQLSMHNPGGAVPPLVIVCSRIEAGMTPWHPDWRAQAQELGLDGEVQFLEYVAEEDLPAVYHGALALCFPSTAEGFGLTPLEAMACGTPVICSNTSSLPEVVGKAGILLPPDDPTPWASAMLQVSSNVGLRTALRAAGLQQAAPFTWDRTGADVLEVLHSVASRT